MANQTTEPPAEGFALRQQRIQARKELFAKWKHKIERIRVVPANDDLRRVMKHPSGIKFPKSGSVEWPLDRFTRRRLEDGSITREQQPQQTPSRHRAPPAE